MQSSSQIITTNKPTSSFLQAGCPSCRPTNSVKALKGKIPHPMELLTPSSPGVFQLCLWPLIAPGYLGGGLPCLSSAQTDVTCQYPIRSIIIIITITMNGVYWSNIVGIVTAYYILYSLLILNIIRNMLSHQTTHNIALACTHLLICIIENLYML